MAPGRKRSLLDLVKLTANRVITWPLAIIERGGGQLFGETLFSYACFYYLLSLYSD